MNNETNLLFQKRDCKPFRIMKTIKTYLEYLIQLNNKVVILSTTLSELYEIEYDKFISHINNNLEKFPTDSISFLKESPTEHIGRSTIIAFTENAIATLSKLYPEDEKSELNSEIIKAIIEMKTLIETNQLKSEIDFLSRQKTNFVDEVQKRLKVMIDTDFQNTKNELFEMFTLAEKEKIGLA